ncbi:MAG: hypothetical protein AB7T20_13345 [Steroidobacteraceae bacterium]
MNNADVQKVNWVGAGLSLAWIAFFIACLFIRTNYPRTSFAVTFLAETRVIWTLAGSFVVMLIMSLVISALLARSKDAAPSNSIER